MDQFIDPQNPVALQQPPAALVSSALIPSPADPTKEKPLYKAFISYSHSADSRLAAALQTKLERFAKPWYHPRNFRIFRDATNLSSTPGLWPTIQEALKDSEFLILMASPTSASSVWVRQELSYWRTNKSVEKLLIVLSDGVIAWDSGSNDFDWSKTTALPRLLEGAFAFEPLFVPLTHFRSLDLSLNDPSFLDSVASLAAPLHGKSKDEIYGAHILEHRKTMRLPGRWRRRSYSRSSLRSGWEFWPKSAGAPRRSPRKGPNGKRASAKARLLSVQSRDVLKSNTQLALLLAVEAAGHSGRQTRRTRCRANPSRLPRSDRWDSVSSVAERNGQLQGKASGEPAGNHCVCIHS